jgi:hypothetical protein
MKLFTHDNIFIVVATTDQLLLIWQYIENVPSNDENVFSNAIDSVSFGYFR